MSDHVEGVKILVTLPPETVEDIEALSRRLGVTPSELLQRAVSLEKYVDDVEENDGKLLVETADRKIKLITRR
jgi:predicted DNA-binding protein